MAGESRGLVIVGEFRDRMSAALTRVRASIANTEKAFAKFARVVTAPFRAVGKTIGNLRSQILSVQNIVTGFVAFLAIRRGFGFLEELAQGLDEIVKLSDRLQATTESLSALRYIGDLSAVSFQEVSVALATYSRNIEAARRGSLAQADAFRALGLNVEELSKQTRIDLVDLLVQTADGMKNLGSATERNNALLTVFGESGARLGPVLATGSEGIRELADEADRLGVIFSKEQLDRAAAFNDALTRFSTSIRATFQRLFIDVAPRISALFENLAFAISDNRSTIVEAAKEIGRAIGQVLSLIVDGVVEFVGALESIPGVNLSGPLGAELKRVEQRLERLTILSDRLKLAQSGAVFVDDPGTRFEIQDLQKKIEEELSRPGIREAAERQGELLALGIGDGLAGALRSRIGSFREALETTLAEIDAGGAGSVSQDAGRRAGELFGRGFADGVGDAPGADGLGAAGPSQGDIRSEAATGTRLLNLQRALLDVQVPTQAVQLSLIQVNTELARLGLQNQALEFLETGAIAAEDMARAFAGLDEAARRSSEEVKRATAEQRLQFEAEVLSLGEQTAEVQMRLAEIAIDLRAFEFDRAFAEGRISAEQLEEAMAALERSLERLTDKARDDFGEGFRQGIERATDGLLSMQKLGEDAAGAVIGQLTNGLGNALGDIVTGTKSAKEAFRDFGLETLRILGQLLARLIAIQAIRALGLGFEAGGVMPGEMRQPSRLPVRQYATGGIARTPQMAVFGEGQSAEAFVPLPDGRRIPVDLRNAGGGGLTLVVNTVDSKDTARWFLENRGLLLAIQNAGLESSAASRRAVRSVS